MTPEQEDAHWALMGKPLMREWRAYCRACVEHKDYKRKAHVRRCSGDSTTAMILEGYSNDARDASLEIWRRCGFEYEPLGAVADGVFYSREEGEGLMKLEDYDD